MANVLFKRGTLEKYNALVQAGTVDANTIYFITDAQKIYLGDKLYAEGQDLFITKSEDEVKSFLRLLFHITMPSLVNVFMSNNKDLIYKNYCLELDILKRGFYR